MDGKAAGEAFTLVVSEERLWNSCVGVLRTRVPEAAWQSCFGVARPVALEGSCLVLSWDLDLGQDGERVVEVHHRLDASRDRAAEET